MQRTQKLQGQSMAELLEILPYSKSTINRRIDAELWTPPVKIGGRAVIFLEHETNELLAAYINGFSDSEIRSLVKKLVDERKQLVAHLGGKA